MGVLLPGCNPTSDDLNSYPEVDMPLVTSYTEAHDLCLLVTSRIAPHAPICPSHAPMLLPNPTSDDLHCGTCTNTPCLRSQPHTFVIP
jgi:hypothetical protein